MRLQDSQDTARSQSKKSTNVDYKTQNRKSNSKQKTSPQSYKIEINILPFPGLAQSGTEQPGQGATLLGWPKSIYYD